MFCFLYISTYSLLCRILGYIAVGNGEEMIGIDCVLLGIARLRFYRARELITVIALSACYGSCPKDVNRYNSIFVLKKRL